MSKRARQEQSRQNQQKSSGNVATSGRRIEPYRQCPLCWNGQRGAGLAYSTHGSTRYYKCQNCGHTWTAQVKVEVLKVEHRPVEMNERGEHGAERESDRPTESGAASAG